MYSGSRQCGSLGNLAYSLSSCLMFSSEVGRSGRARELSAENNAVYKPVLEGERCLC